MYRFQVDFTNNVCHAYIFSLSGFCPFLPQGFCHAGYYRFLPLVFSALAKTCQPWPPHLPSTAVPFILHFIIQKTTLTLNLTILTWWSILLLIFPWPILKITDFSGYFKIPRHSLTFQKSGNPAIPFVWCTSGYFFFQRRLCLFNPQQ